MTEVAIHAPVSDRDEHVEEALDRSADGFAHQIRSPVLHWPNEVGLDYEDITFPAMDGVPLEGWFIPAAGSRRLVVVNHPMGFSRSGLPTHLEPWRSIWGPSGNDFEVDFLPDYRILHDAGYNVIAYDLRNLGLSGAANGGIASSGTFEARDVAGSLRYAQRFEGMSVSMFSRCLGCNSTLAAAVRYPEYFAGVRSLVGAQPVTTAVITRHQLRLAGVPEERLDDLDERVKVRTGIGLAAREPRMWARSLRVPTFLYQVHDDLLTDPSDVQAIHDQLGTDDKQLLWIRGTTARWDGYLEFQRRPEPMLDWFERHL